MSIKEEIKISHHVERVDGEEIRNLFCIKSGGYGTSLYVNKEDVPKFIEALQEAYKKSND